MNVIGVIGSGTSVDNIMKVSQEHIHNTKRNIRLVPLPYEDVSEVGDIIQENNSINGWFFSGLIPYVAGKKYLSTGENYVFGNPTESGVYRLLIKAMLEHKMKDLKLSVDMVDYDNFFINELLHGLEFEGIQLYFKKFSGELNYEGIMDHHVKLWNENKVNGVITVSNVVYKRLKEKSIPVYRVTLTKMEILHSLEILIEKVKGSYFKNNQIGVEIIRILNFDDVVDNTKTRYHLQHIEIKIKQILLDFCDHIDGALIENGNGYYQIFSSRRSIFRQVKGLYEVIEHLAMELGLKVNVGIGLGEAAFDAEINARKALHQSVQSGVGIVVLIEENGLVSEFIGQENELNYLNRDYDLDLIEKLSEANISINTYNRVKALTNRMEWTGFTNAKLSNYLSMSLRNAQKITQKLLNIGLIEEQGVEKVVGKGRPTKIYAFVDKDK
jgi:hypothetical protein